MSVALLEDIGQFVPASLHRPGLSEAEWTQLCEKYSDYQLEYSSEGDLLIMPGTDWLTSRRNAAIVAALRAYSISDGRGFASESSGSFLLPNGARRSPDAAWISRSRAKILQDSHGRIPVCVPEFVIELKSSQDSRRKLREKLSEWLENGVELTWLIDPELREVWIYRQGDTQPQVFSNPIEIQGEGIMAGFTLLLQEIWEPS